MDKIEYRAVIKYLVLKGNTLTQIKHELDSVYGDSAPSFTTVKFWAAEFKRGRKSLGDDERSGRQKTATTDENIAKLHQMVLDDRRIKVNEVKRVSRSYEHIKRTCCSHIKSRFRHEKAVRALSAAFAHVRPKACSNEHFQRYVDAV
ncbi:protein GVQW3-like [Sitophilus oryzae]|uniref:Protein GVQW3-like n=1 Tax=Sitophilus oryzae TaxID=7048 RepID=A0A6J2X6K1_SITOR|nr:protein GVQW3-like [Sitophilus oryzae]